MDQQALLSALRDIRLPAPPPPEPVWDLLIAAVLITLAICLLAHTILTRRQGWRREALDALAAIDTSDSGRARTAMATLARRVAIELAPDKMSAVSGHAYLVALDELFATTYFSSGPGQAFGDALYRPVDGSFDAVAVRRSMRKIFKQAKRGVR